MARPYTSRPLAFPQATHFSQLFRLVPKGTKGAAWVFEDYNLRTGRARQETIYIGPYLSVSLGHQSLYVRPHPRVIEDIKRNMIAAGVNDEITFEIVVRDLEQALVVAKNSSIIGSRWLALIKPSSIPEFASRRTLAALRYAASLKTLSKGEELKRRSEAADAYEVAADAFEEEGEEAKATLARVKAGELRLHSLRDPRRTRLDRQRRRSR